MVEALGLAVADRPVGEERRIAAAACVKQRPPAPDVQKRLLLAGKAGVGQVLGGGAAANGGCRIGQAQPFAQLLIGGAYPVGDGGRKCAVEKAAADRPASLRKAGLSRTIGLQMAADRKSTRLNSSH